VAAHEPEVTAGTLTRRGFLVASAAATVAVAGGGTAAMAEPGPEEFAGRWWWGTASSAVQCEGASPADDWYRWERAGHAPESGDGNGFRRRYREDFALLRSLGTTDHRLSINWARVEPREGHQDLEAIEYYRSVLAAGRAEGLRIWVCLLHSAIPVWFADRGGFATEDALKTWMRWVELAEKLFGDLVGGWMPVNLATSYAQKAYGTGTFPPGHRDPAELVSVLKTLHHCNFEAALRLRKAGALTCSNEAVLPLEALDRSPGAAAAVARLDELVWGSWLSLAKDPRYAEAWDYIGFSYYFGALVTEKGELLPRPDGAKPGPLGTCPGRTASRWCSTGWPPSCRGGSSSSPSWATAATAASTTRTARTTCAAL
jgi:beta-glucosidase